MQVFALRLKPDQDLRQSLQDFGAVHQIQAGFVLSAIGSLKQASIRFADRFASTELPGRFEILSLQGTLSTHGVHLHIAIADTQGQVIGGHLTEGCIVYTTAEIVIGNSQSHRFLRAVNSETGFQELQIEQSLPQ